MKKIMTGYLTKKTESNFSKIDIKDKNVLLDILEEDEESVIEELKSQEDYIIVNNIEKYLTDLYKSHNTKFVKSIIRYNETNGYTTSKYLRSKGWVGVRKTEEDQRWGILVLIFGLSQSLWFGSSKLLHSFTFVCALIFVFSIYKFNGL